MNSLFPVFINTKTSINKFCIKNKKNFNYNNINIKL